MPVKLIRKRYLAIKVFGEGDFSRRSLDIAVWKHMLRLYGKSEAVKSGFRIISYDQTKGMIIVKCSHRAVDMIKLSLASLVEIEGKPINLQVIGVSGTIRALRRKFLSK